MLTSILQGVSLRTGQFYQWSHTMLITKESLIEPNKLQGLGVISTPTRKETASSKHNCFFFLNANLISTSMELSGNLPERATEQSKATMYK